MTLPSQVSRLLSSAIGRVRRIYLVRGLAVTGIVWLLGVAAVMTVDSRLVIFDDRVRWLMSSGVWLLTLAAIALAIVLPLCRRLDFRRMAKVIDERHPEVEERFSTLVELSESDAAKAGFSTALFALVGDLAERDAAGIDVRREFPLSRALRRLGVLLAILLALGGSIVASPNLVGRLFLRAIAPWVDVGNLYGNDVRVKPGDLVVLAGTVVRIEAEADESLHARPSIRISRRAGMGWTDETFEPMPNGVYETTADIGEREWRYRVNAGPAVTRYYHVRVSEKPKYESFVARVDYPEYTGFRPHVVSNADVSAIRAIEGSRVKFDLRVTEEGTVSDFRIGGRNVFEHQMKSNRTVNWSLELVNRDGFRSSMGNHPLTSFPDQPPTIVIENPAGRLPRLPPHAKIPVEITASDDVRVLRPEVRYSIDGDEMRPFHEVEQFAGAGGNLWRGRTDLDLSTLDLAAARNVKFDIVARDNRPAEYGGPHVVTSAVISVDLEYREWGLEVLDLQEQVKRGNVLIDEAKKRMRDAERLVGELQNELRRDGKVSEATERKNELAAHEAREARERLQDLRDALEADERFRPLARPLEKTLGERLAPALDKIENSPFQERERRADEMAGAAKELKAAAEDMDELARRLKDRAEKVATLEKTKDLAARQEALAKAASELLEERPADLAKLEAWKRLEEEAMRRADEIARERSDADLAEARRKMETAAREIAELKRELEREKAEKSGPEAQRKRAEEKKAAAARAAEALKQAAADQNRAEEAQARADHKAAAAAQRQAEDKLEKAEAMPGVKAMQKLAGEAERKAAENAESKPLAEKAAELQKAASEAVKKEQAIREAMAKGEKSEKDLAALDRDLRKQLRAKADEMSRADRAAAREELKKAGEAQKQAEAAQKGADHKAAAEAQRKAEEALRKADAMPGVKEMQRQASEAEKKSAEDPNSTEKAKTAAAAQKAATEAAKKEQAIREAIEKGRKTEKDLAEMDAALRKELRGKASAEARAEQARQSAEALKKAGEAQKQDEALKAAAEGQRQAESAMKAAAERRAEERGRRQAGDPAAAAQKQAEARAHEQKAGEAQKQAEAALERGQATEGVKAMQKMASNAAENARKDPRSAEKAAKAAAAQAAASEALREERALREGLRKGENTEADLEALDRDYRRAAAEAEAQMAAEEKADAARARERAAEQSRRAQELKGAIADQRRATQNLQGARAARADQRKFEAAKNQGAAQQKAREADSLGHRMEEAQRSAEDRLERGGATEAVKAMQQQASEAARLAQRDPASAEKSAAAEAAQKAAEAALQKELDIREGMRKGELTEDDLEAMNRALKDELVKGSEARATAAKANAERAFQKARDAIGSSPQDEIDRLADAALEAKRSAIAAEIAEAELKDDADRAEALHGMADDLAALEARNAEAEARENRILSLQRDAAEAIARGDRNRARKLQKEIDAAQARAAESTDGTEEAEEAREAANEAQAEADKVLADSERNWNWDTATRDAAGKAQNAAAEKERKAQAEARASRTLDKMAAAQKGEPSKEESGQPDSSEPSSEGKQEGQSEGKPAQGQNASKAANAAAEAMNREVNAQAAALGMSRNKPDGQSKNAEKGKKGDEKSAGGGVSDEVRALARELERNDSPNFLKSLFSRMGWFKIRGISKDGAGDYDLKEVPPEYRDLVRRYFLKLAEENK